MKTRLKPKHRAALVVALGPGAADLSTCALSDGALVRLAAGLIVDLRLTLKTTSDRRDEAEAELGSLRAQRAADLAALAEALGRPLTHPNDPAAMGALVSDVVMRAASVESKQDSPIAIGSRARVRDNVRHVGGRHGRVTEGPDAWGFWCLSFEGSRDHWWCDADELEVLP